MALATALPNFVHRPAVSASCQIERASTHSTVYVGGDWLLGEALRFDDDLRRIAETASIAVTIDLSHLRKLDTTGAWLLARTSRILFNRQIPVTWKNVPEQLKPLLNLVGSECTHPPTPASDRHTFRYLLERVGRGFLRAMADGLALLNFFGRVIVESLIVVRHPGRLRVAAIFVQVEEAGINALPILGLLSFLIGVVLAYQGAEQFHRYGADIYTVNLISVTVLREMGVMITAIIVAGRSGSAFTAQIGVMEVDEEVDAIQTMGLSVVEVLILPRLLGLIIALPLLTFFANIMGVVGGAVVCYFSLGIPLSAFFDQLQRSMYGWSFWLGLMKAPVFALLIGTVGCLEGLRVERNAASVGRQTTRSVVESLFFVILADALFSILFQKLGI